MDGIEPVCLGLSSLHSRVNEKRRRAEKGRAFVRRASVVRFISFPRVFTSFSKERVGCLLTYALQDIEEAGKGAVERKNEEQKGRRVGVSLERDVKEIVFEQFEVLTKSCLVKGEIRILYRLEPLFDTLPAHNSSIQPCKPVLLSNSTPKFTLEKTVPALSLFSLHSPTPIGSLPIHPRPHR